MFIHFKIGFKDPLCQCAMIMERYIYIVIIHFSSQDPSKYQYSKWYVDSKYMFSFFLITTEIWISSSSVSIIRNMHLWIEHFYKYTVFEDIMYHWKPFIHYIWHPCNCYCHLDLDHVVLFAAFTFAVEIAPRVYSLFPRIWILVVKYKIYTHLLILNFISIN